MLETAGFRFSRQNRLDLAPCANLPITLVFLPAADIPKYVGEGNIDMGITGHGTNARRAGRSTAGWHSKAGGWALEDAHEPPCPWVHCRRACFP